MATSNDSIPKPRRRLLRTLLKRPRKIRRFAPRISFEEAAATLPDLQETGHWGQVVLLSDLVIALHRDGTVSRLFHLTTMLHGDHDLAEWDEVTRDYDPRNSLETVRRSLVHLPDGTKRKAKRTVTPVDPHTRVVSLTFLPLRPGVVLEFEEQYDHFVPLDVAPGIWDQMFLQGPAPCRRLRFTVAVSQPFQAEIKLHNCDWQPQESEEHGYHVFRWDLRDVPGIEMDQWTPPPRDFAPWVDVTTLPSWKPVARHYMKELQPAGTAPPEVKQLLGELTGDAKTDREKVSAIYRYTTRDVRYGRHPHELTLEAPREAGKMLEDLRGDCKDKSALMVSMLRELNIPAKIALVLTRMNGETPFLPAPRFDHALVRTEVDGEDLWLDAAGGPYTFGDIPFNDQGINALILDGENSVMSEVPRADPSQHRTERICRGRIEPDGTYRFDAEVTNRGEQAVVLRLNYLDRSEEHRLRTLAQSVAVDLTGADVSNVQFTELEDLTRDVGYTYTLALKRWGRPIQDILLFRIPWSEPVQTSGPVSASERMQPLLAPGVLGMFERHEIELPAGFSDYGLPYVTEEESEWGKYSCRITAEGSRLVCERRVDYLSGIIPPERFAEFKRFWEACARADAADMVLMKKAQRD